MLAAVGPIDRLLRPSNQDAGGAHLSVCPRPLLHGLLLAVLLAYVVVALAAQTDSSLWVPGRCCTGCWW
jgi:hypothetical protein